MKYLRWVIAAIILAYAGWIAFPVVKTMMAPETYDPIVPTRQMDAEDHAGGMSTFPTDNYGADIAPAESIQGETAVIAMETDNKPVIWLWAGVVALYLGAAFLLANGNLRAAFAYGGAFLADVALTYLTKGEAGSGIFDRIIETLSVWDPRYTLTLIALVLGFIILMARERPLRKRRFVE